MVEMHNIYPLRTPLNIEKICNSLYGTNTENNSILTLVRLDYLGPKGIRKKIYFF